MSASSLTTKKGNVIPSAVLGMLIFIFTEIMIFASFMSAFMIIKSSFANWPPMGQPRLPVYATAINSLFLLASGLLLQFSYRSFVKGRASTTVLKSFLSATIFGIFFLLLQGMEWFRLIRFGLTLTSSVYGSFFYLIIGAHALHVIAACVFLLFLYSRLVREKLEAEGFAALRLFWFFVVGLWPVLYVMVYL